MWRVLRGRDMGGVGSVGAVHFGSRHLIGVDTKLVHPCDERRPFESKAGGGAILSANTPTRFLEGLHDLMAVDFGENTSHWRASRRPGVRGFADRC